MKSRRRFRSRRRAVPCVWDLRARCGRELHGWRGRVILLDGREGLAGILVSLKAGGAEEDDGVLYLLAAEARQGFLIFGHDAEDASIRAVEERWIFVRHWRGFEVISHIETRNQKS